MMLSKDFSTSGAFEGSLRPNSARELVETTGISYENLYEILTDRQQPHKRQITTTKQFDLSEFSPISYTQVRSRRTRSPKSMSMRKNRISRFRDDRMSTNNFLHGLSDISDVEEDEEFRLHEEEDSEILSDDDYDDDEIERRRIQKREKQRKRKMKKRPFTASGGIRRSQSPKRYSQPISRLKHLLPGDHRDLSNVDDVTEISPDLIDVLKEARDLNIKRGKSTPFLRYFGSQKVFNDIMEKNDPFLRKKNTKIREKVHQIQRQDAYEKKILDEVKTHLRREKIRSSFRAQQQKNLIKHLKYYYSDANSNFGGNDYNSTTSSPPRSPSQKMKDRVVDNFMNSIRSFTQHHRPSTSPGRYRQNNPKRGGRRIRRSRRNRGSMGSYHTRGANVSEDRIDFNDEKVEDDNMDEFAPLELSRPSTTSTSQRIKRGRGKRRRRRNENSSTTNNINNNSQFRKSKKRVTLASTHFLRKELEKKRKKEKEMKIRKKERYKKLYHETMSEIQEFEKRKQQQQAIREGDDFDSVMRHMKTVPKVVGKTKYYT